MSFHGGACRELLRALEMRKFKGFVQLLSSSVLEDDPSLDVGAGGASWPLLPTPHPRQTRQVDATRLPHEPGGWSESGPLHAGSRAPGVVARPTSVWPPFPPSAFAQDSWKNCRIQCEGTVSQLPPHTHTHVCTHTHPETLAEQGQAPLKPPGEGAGQARLALCPGPLDV